MCVVSIEIALCFTSEELEYTHTHTPCSPPAQFLEEDDDIGYVMYDLDDLDINWLESVNQKRKFRG